MLEVQKSDWKLNFFLREKRNVRKASQSHRRELPESFSRSSDWKISHQTQNSTKQNELQNRNGNNTQSELAVHHSNQRLQAGNNRASRRRQRWGPTNWRHCLRRLNASDNGKLQRNFLLCWSANWIFPFEGFSPEMKIPKRETMRWETQKLWAELYQLLLAQCNFEMGFLCKFISGQ